MTTKITSANIDATVASTADIAPVDSNTFNISLLGFKMAVNEGLTVFNLVDGVVDEFNDESGTDESEGSNDTYCGSNDYYINDTSPTGSPFFTSSAGFSTTTITEPDTSTAGTNPTTGSGSFGSYTVPSCVTSLTVMSFGSGGSNTGSPGGGGGGFAYGTLAVTPSQSFTIVAGEGGANYNPTSPVTPPQGPLRYATRPIGGGGRAAGECGYGGSGGGLSGIFEGCVPTSLSGSNSVTATAPQAYLIAGSGGGGGYQHTGGPGGGLTGLAGGTFVATTSGGPLPFVSSEYAGGGGDQEQGGQGAGTDAANGELFKGGNGRSGGHSSSGGGSGYYGGGSSGTNDPTGPNSGHSGGSGGGSSYIGHPQITCGVTYGNTVAGVGPTTPVTPLAPTADRRASAVNGPISGPQVNPLTGVSDALTGYTNPPDLPSNHTFGDGVVSNVTNSESDGYVFLFATQCASTTSTTIVSNAFTSSSVATNARIVVFEENVDTPTLNTDIIASISRDAGVTFTNATLSDSGYVTGSSGQRILTGQADISGQPSGQSMRWKLALANNTVKIHGVSLQWS